MINDDYKWLCLSDYTFYKWGNLLVLITYKWYFGPTLQVLRTYRGFRCVMGVPHPNHHPSHGPWLRIETTMVFGILEFKEVPCIQEHTTAFLFLRDYIDVGKHMNAHHSPRLEAWTDQRCLRAADWELTAGWQILWDICLRFVFLRGEL